MTVEEAIKELKEAIDCCTSGEEEYFKESLGMGILAIEEIQQYRAIGTVEDYWKLNEMCKEYSAIGTIEEFKALKEKNVAKKPNGIERKRDDYGFIYQIGKCPCCGKLVTDDRECCDCMQKLDWQ